MTLSTTSVVMTAHQFRKISSGGKLAFRPRGYKVLDQMLDGLHRASDPSGRYAYLIATWYRAAAMARHRKTRGRRLSGLYALMQQLSAAIQSMQSMRAASVPIARPAPAAGWSAAAGNPERTARLRSGGHRAPPPPTGWQAPQARHDPAMTPRAAPGGHRPLPPIPQQTYVPPPTPAQRRWDMLRGLFVAQGGTGAHVALSSDMYRLEYWDPEHRFGQIHSVFFPEWQDEHVKGLTTLSYWDWLNLGRVKDDMQHVIDQLKAQGVNNYNVRYLDADERMAYQVTLDTRLMLDANGDPFHTGNHKTHSQGSGWAIWVMSPDRKFYSGSHVVAEFHHSSFLSGTPVKAAGEWVWNKGRLVAINGKSGHYTPGQNPLLHTLFLLHRAGVDLKQVALQTIPSKTGPHMNADSWLRAGGDDTKAAAHPAPIAPGPWTPTDDVSESDYTTMMPALFVKPSNYISMSPSNYTSMTPGPP